jgi:hypothetical protein
MLNLGDILMIGKVWVMNSQWDINSSYTYFILDSFHGHLIFSRHHGDIPGFRNFVQTANPSKYPEDYFIAALFFIYFKCSIYESDCERSENCPHNVSLEWLPGNLFNMDMSEESYNIYNAVYAVAHTLHEILLHHIQMQPMGKAK